MTAFPFLAQRLFNTPLIVHPGKAEIIMAALAERLGVTQLTRADGAAVTLSAPSLSGDPEPERPYDVTGDGIAIIPVRGTLVQRNGLHPWSGMTGLDGVRTKFALALADDDVRAIIFDIDSPGGEVAGTFDLADGIYGARGVKPMHAILNEGAYSGAYALASACDWISVPRTGGAGSIGVIALLVDFSKALTSAGIAVNIIQFGKHKADGNQAVPLSDDARARFQDQVDEIGELFVSTIARNRGLRTAQVRATEAATFLGAEAVSLGLADIVSSPDAAYRALAPSL